MPRDPRALRLPRFVFVLALLLASFVGVTVLYVLLAALIIAIADTAIGYEITEAVTTFLLLGGCLVPIVVPLLVTASIYGRARRALLSREIYEHAGSIRARTCPRCGSPPASVAGGPRGNRSLGRWLPRSSCAGSYLLI